MGYHFKCKKCGCTIFRSIEVGTIISTDIIRILDDGTPVSNDPEIVEPCIISRYECVKCRQVITNKNDEPIYYYSQLLNSLSENQE